MRMPGAAHHFSIARLPERLSLPAEQFQLRSEGISVVLPFAAVNFNSTANADGPSAAVDSMRIVFLPGISFPETSRSISLPNAGDSMSHLSLRKIRAEAKSPTARKRADWIFGGTSNDRVNVMMPFDSSTGQIQSGAAERGRESKGELARHKNNSSRVIRRV